MSNRDRRIDIAANSTLQIKLPFKYLQIVTVVT
jgi:hypothetical protein